MKRNNISAVIVDADCFVLEPPENKGQFSVYTGTRFDLSLDQEIDGVPAFYISGVEACTGELQPGQSGRISLRILADDETAKNFTQGLRAKLTHGSHSVVAECLLLGDVKLIRD